MKAETATPPARMRPHYPIPNSLRLTHCTIAEARSILRVSRATLQRWRHRGLIAVVAINARVLMYDREQVLALRDRKCGAANSIQSRNT